MSCLQNFVHNVVYTHLFLEFKMILILSSSLNFRSQKWQILFRSYQILKEHWFDSVKFSTLHILSSEPTQLVLNQNKISQSSFKMVRASDTTRRTNNHILSSDYQIIKLNNTS